MMKMLQSAWFWTQGAVGTKKSVREDRSKRFSMQTGAKWHSHPSRNDKEKVLCCASVYRLNS